MRTSFDEVYEELATEHKELMSLVAEIDAFEHAVGLSPVLERLHELLIRHFSHEQFPGGLYERMGAYGSAYHAELKALIEDHCILLSGVRALFERAKATGTADESTLMSDLAEFIAHLRRHEQREHELAEKLITLDTLAEGPGSQKQ